MNLSLDQTSVEQGSHMTLLRKKTQVEGEATIKNLRWT